MLFDDLCNYLFYLDYSCRYGLVYIIACIVIRSSFSSSLNEVFVDNNPLPICYADVDGFGGLRDYGEALLVFVALLLF